MNPIELYTLISSKPLQYNFVLKNKENIEFKNFLMSLNGKTLNENIMLYCSNQQFPNVCSQCNKYVSLKDNNIKKGWNIYCSKGCATKIKNKERYINNPALLKKFTKSYNKTWHNNELNKEVVKNQQLNREKNNFQKYGVLCTLSIPKIQKKAHESCNKSMHSYKKFISPITNKEYKIRGYEHLAIMLLEQQNKQFIASDFETPVISYGKHNYYPDIYVKSDNKIIEVKSDYWLYKQYEKNLKIQKAVLEKGFNFEFWIFDNKTNLQIINII